MEGDGIHVRDVPIRVRVTVAGDRVRPTSRARLRSSRGISTARSPSHARRSTSASGRSAIPTSRRRAARSSGRGGRAQGLPCERAASGGRRRREHRDVEPDRRRRHVRARARRPRAGARPGDDEQRHVRDAGVHLLRDARRRPGRRSGGAGPERRPCRDVEHPEHADRGARARVSAAGRALRPAAADGRSRPPPRRRRRAARLPRAGRLPLGPHDRAPPSRPARRRGRRGRRTGRQPSERPPPARQVQPRPEGGRRPRDPHPGRRRLGPA